MRPTTLLPVLMMFGCAAGPSENQPEPTKSSPAGATQPATTPATTPAPGLEPAKVADVAAPPVPLAQIRGLGVTSGKLRIEIPIDDPVLGMPALAPLHQQFKATDGISRKADPTAKDIPAGLREGDSWVVLTEQGAELVTVTGLGFPAGGDAKLAWLVLRDEPNEQAFGLAWPGTQVPAGIKMAAPPPSTAPDDATARRLLAALEPAATKPRHAPAAEFMRVTRGQFAHGHTHLLLLSPPPLTAAERGNFPASVHGAWTLGATDGPAPVIEKVYQSTHDMPLTVRALIDWNGDGTHDAVVLNQHEEDDNSDYPTLVVWQDGAPRARELAPYAL